MHSVCSGAAGAAYHMYLIWHVEGEATGEVMLSALRFFCITSCPGVLLAWLNKYHLGDGDRSNTPKHQSWFIQDALFSGAPLHFEGCSKRLQKAASRIFMVRFESNVLRRARLYFPCVPLH